MHLRKMVEALAEGLREILPGRRSGFRREFLGLLSGVSWVSGWKLPPECGARGLTRAINVHTPCCFEPSPQPLFLGERGFLGIFSQSHRVGTLDGAQRLAAGGACTISEPDQGLAVATAGRSHKRIELFGWLPCAALKPACTRLNTTQGS
jgi:hypothetical protein